MNEHGAIATNSTNEPRDFRRFLQQTLLERCRKNPRYSLRAFARHLNLSPSALSAMLRGVRPISARSRTKLGLALGLGPEEIDSFAYEAHGNSKGRSEPAKPTFEQIAMDTFAIVSEWHHYAILELMKTQSFSWDATGIARRLGLNATEVSVSIERLVRVGLLERTGDGYRDTTKGFSSDLRPGLTSAAHRKFQKETLQRALDAVDDVSLENRDNTSMMMAIDVADLPVAREKIKAFRRELCGLMEKTSSPNEVYQLAVAFYPLSKKERGA